MVTNYTADESGDFFIATLQDPYYNVLKILDWNIVVGLKKPNMTGSVTASSSTQTIFGSGTQFTTSFAPGDSIIVGNLTYEIDTVTNNSELTVTEPITFGFTNTGYYTTPNSSNFFDYQFRWSQTGDLFSELVELNHTEEYPYIEGIEYDPTKPLHIDIKAEVSELVFGNTLTFISIEFTIETESGVIISCPNFCEDCEDPFSMNGCANILVECSSNQFNPYNLTKSIKIYKQLVGIVNRIFGHDVTYFKTEPDLRTTDVILMEYSLHNVVDKKTIKILVPDNEFPTESVTYDIFGIELQDFEIHITAEEFESQFGLGKYPRNKDYMYIPIINAMYEINSISLADEFNQSSSYWKVKLVKYQDRGDVIKRQFENDTDILVTGIEEVFGARIQEEYTKNLKQEQFQTVINSSFDGIRKFINTETIIKDYELKNRWTLVSKNYYNFTKIPVGTTSVSYEATSKVESGNNVAYTSWFAVKFPLNSIENYTLITDANNIFKITISNTELEVSTPVGVETFTHGITFDRDDWYGYVVNINNEFLQISASIYSIDETITGNLPHTAQSNLINKFSETRPLTGEIIWDSQSSYELRSNRMNMTNIRVFDTPIEFEQHTNILNQYVVRDNQRSIIIDNAIPNIKSKKFANAR